MKYYLYHDLCLKNLLVCIQTSPTQTGFPKTKPLWGFRRLHSTAQLLPPLLLLLFATAFLKMLFFPVRDHRGGWAWDRKWHCNHRILKHSYPLEIFLS